jgi:2-isopropylmalate synthase
MTFDSEEELNLAFSRFKDLADKKHEIFDEDLQALVTDATLDAANERVKLVSMRVCSETGETPHAEVVLSVDGEESPARPAAAARWTPPSAPSRPSSAAAPR